MVTRAHTCFQVPALPGSLSPISHLVPSLPCPGFLNNGAPLSPFLFSMEKIHRFDHERIPERAVHARGVGAHGHFCVFDDRASKYTFASVLTDPSRTTPVFVRFSTVQGSRGSADTARDVRGFATRLYTPEGNWDTQGALFDPQSSRYPPPKLTPSFSNDIPVFFVHYRHGSEVDFRDSGRSPPSNPIRSSIMKRRLSNLISNAQVLPESREHEFEFEILDASKIDLAGGTRPHRAHRGINFGSPCGRALMVRASGRPCRFQSSPADSLNPRLCVPSSRLLPVSIRAMSRQSLSPVDAGPVPRAATIRQQNVA